MHNCYKDTTSRRQTTQLNCLLVCTYQNIFQFYVSVQKALTMQEADPLHHVESNLKSLPQW